MAFDLGSVVTLTCNITDGNGQSANGGTVTLTVTQPDSSVFGPITVTPGSTGAYTYLFTPTLAGRHLARWLSVGINAGAITEAFDVTPADPGYLVSLEDVKAQLNMTTNRQDGELRLYVEAATDVVERFVGGVVPRTYTEVHDGGNIAITTYHRPVLSVQSVTENWGYATYNLSNEPVGFATDYYGYSLDDAYAGRIVRRGPGSFPMQFMNGRGNISVTYTAGRTVIPAAIRLATLIIVAHLWETQRGSVGPNGQPEPVDLQQGDDFAIPDRAMELLERFEAPQVIV